MADRALALLKALAWPSAGAAVGVSVGVIAAHPETAPYYLGGLSVLGFGVGLFGIAYWVRERRRLRAQRAPAKAAPATAHVPALDVSLRFESIRDGHPDVWGIGEALALAARVTRAGAPAAGVRLRLATGAASLAEGATDADGWFRATVVVPGAGATRLVAQADGADASASAEREIRLVRYAEEIPRLVNDLRAWAAENLPGGHPAMTVREISDALALRAPKAERAAGDAALVFEAVEYGERRADRALYERLLAAFAELEAAGALAPSEEAPARV